MKTPSVTRWLASALFAAAALTCTWLVCEASASEQSLALRAGVAKVEITPQKLPIAMSGSFQKKEATGVHDPLFARAIVLDDGKTRVAIVVCDCLLLTRDIFDAAKEMAFKQTGIEASHMLMAATHTHSGPVTVPLGGTKPDAEYVKFLTQQLAEAVIAANKTLQPAGATWTTAQEPNEVHNRRWFVKPEAMLPDPFGRTEEKVRTNPPASSDVLLRPAGPVDPEVVSLWIASHGNPLALLSNYSLHYVGNIPPNELSADYFGEFERQMNKQEGTGEELVGILTNGTSGDINNIEFRKQIPSAAPFERIRQVAGRLAEVVDKSLQGQGTTAKISIDIRERTLTLGIRRPSEAEVERARKIIANAYPEKFTRDETYAFDAIRLSEGPASVEVPLQVMRIGKLGIVALPCEAFAEIGLEIKRHSPLRPTCIIGLANGYYGYLPTPGQHDLGGYETWPCSWSYLERDASAKITEAVVEMLAEVATTDAISPQQKPATPSHALYFVVPQNERTFNESIRTELGILGPLKTHWPQRHRFRFKHGYLAWLSLPEVKRVREHPDVIEVTAYLPDDVVEGARPRGIAKNYLDVTLSPNNWETAVDPATFRATDAMAAIWADQFQHDSNVTVALGDQPNVVRVTFAAGKPDRAIVDAIRRSGQVQIMHWSQDPPE